jgi:hypothetical protein
MNRTSEGTSPCSRVRDRVDRVRVGLRGAQGGDGELGAVPEERPDHVFLGGEVPVERPRGDAGLGRDLLHGRRRVAGLGEHPHGGASDLQAQLGRPTLGQAGATTRRHGPSPFGTRMTAVTGVSF